MEARYFEVFRQYTSRELAGAFGLSFWDRVVLQACRDEPFALHAVIALGALSMSIKTGDVLEASSGVPLSSSSLDQHHTIAIVQYDRALYYMRQLGSTVKYSLRKALLSCLLVFCFESFHGRRDLAIAHAQSGQKLLREYISTQANNTINSAETSSPATSVVDYDIIHAFARLDLLLLTAIDTRPRRAHNLMALESCTIIKDMPSSFKTIQQANFYLELIMKQIGHFMASTLGYHDPSGLVPDLPQDPRDDEMQMRLGINIYTFQGVILPDHLRPEHTSHTSDIYQWFTCFGPLAQQNRAESCGLHEQIATRQLSVHARTIKILLAATLFSKQTCYDAFLEDFISIVEDVKYVSQRQATFSSKSERQQTRFSFDLSLLPPVTIVGLCCRDWDLRREALAILRTPTVDRELFWNNKLFAGQVAFIIQTEEEGLMYRQFIPESKRARVLSVSTDEIRKVASVRILQHKEDGLAVTETPVGL